MQSDKPPRRFPTTLLVLVVALVGGVIGAYIFVPIELARYHSVQKIRDQKSEVHLVETQTHAVGPIVSETLRLDNVDGNSTASYDAIDRRGYKASFRQPLHGYDVTFAFELLVRDGIWDLTTPAEKHGDLSTVYHISIAQVAGSRSGSRKFAFADPHYLATRAGNEYEIHLDPHKATPSESDIVNMKSTSLSDPRYQKIVDDFASFGPPAFRKTVAAARAKLHA
jgi:hypothetical protein